jgi:hypothetical protein
MFHKNVTKVQIFMVSLLRRKGYGGQAGFSVQVSVSWFKGSRVQRLNNNNNRSDVMSVYREEKSAARLRLSLLDMLGT